VRVHFDGIVYEFAAFVVDDPNPVDYVLARIGEIGGSIREALRDIFRGSPRIALAPAQSEGQTDGSAHSNSNPHHVCIALSVRHRVVSSSCFHFIGGMRDPIGKQERLACAATQALEQ
jgi:hypothetical protein